MNALHHEEIDKSRVALLLIDMINPLDFDGGDALLRYALPMAGRLAEFKRRAKTAGIPAIYVNDNFGRWRSDFKQIIDHCTQQEMPGKPVVEKLLPEKEDFFVLKPRHSGFFSTSLGPLLSYLGVEKTIITGMATDICVLFTANDAYLSDFGVFVPCDCVAAEQERYNRDALDLMIRVLKAETTSSTELDLERMRGER